MYPEYTGYTRRQVKTLHKRIHYASYTRPDSVRGTSPAFMLLLNAQEYKGYSPMQPDPGKFLSLCSALFPLLCGIGFLVIHINVDREQIPAFFYLGMQGHTTQRPPKPEPPVETAILVLTDPTSILMAIPQTMHQSPDHPYPSKRSADLRRSTGTSNKVTQKRNRNKENGIPGQGIKKMVFIAKWNTRPRHKKDGIHSKNKPPYNPITS